LIGDTLVLAMHDGTVVGVAAGTLEQRFEVKLDAPLLAAPLRLGSALYVLSSNAVVWRIADGNARRLVELEGAARASFAQVDNRLVVGLLDGRLIALDTEGRKLWEQQLPRSVVAPAIASGSALFVTMINGEVWKLSDNTDNENPEGGSEEGG
jgi:outer membrane protein assembly factor BamB